MSLSFYQIEKLMSIPAKQETQIEMLKMAIKKQDRMIALLERIVAAEPERTGRWIDDGSELGCACSECGASLDEYISNLNEYNHLIKYPRVCPNCGSDNSGGGA